MMQRVSIIIPVYNVEPYIEECLLSVAKQTVSSQIECIIVDDCGTDNSICIAQQFIDTYNGEATFRIIHRGANGGLSAARNSGIREAKGEYIYFLDSDDYIIPACIETLLRMADKYEGVDLLPALYIRENNDMEQFGSHSFPEFSDNLKEIKRALLDYDRIPVTAANRLVRRELIIKNNLLFKEGIIHEDNYWTFFLAKHVNRMAFCAEKLYYYRETPGSITKKPNIEKESHAFSIIIKDFCENIDDFERGVQKRYILMHLLTTYTNRYYHSASHFIEICQPFCAQNNLIEKLLLYIIFQSKPNSLIYKKAINAIQRLYLL